MNNNNSLDNVLEGILHLFAETGTEGEEFWAFQDSRYIQKNVPRGYCKNCGSSSCGNPKHQEEIGDLWNYKGLHTLKEGDHLIIYNKDNKEVWSGVINGPYVFSERAGMRIRADFVGRGIDVCEEYFLKLYHARLIPANKQ